MTSSKPQTASKTVKSENGESAAVKEKKQSSRKTSSSKTPQSVVECYCTGFLNYTISVFLSMVEEEANVSGK